MRVRRQDLIPVLLHSLGVSHARATAARIQGQAIVRFIAFHDIPPADVGAFQEKIRALKERANVISIEDFLAGRISKTRLNVSITFDDGYKSWITEGAPLLKALQMPATFFVSSGFVGLDGARAKEFVREQLKLQADTTGPLTADDVRALADQGFSIGGHTCHHVNLSRLSETQIREEIIRDKNALEAITGRAVSFFAFPFGAANNSLVDLRRVVEESGYKAAVTTCSGLNTRQGDKFAIRRELTSAAMSKKAFIARIYGNQDAIQVLKSAASRFRSRRGACN